jgi:DNA-binding CsgD family transcriptional regulator
MLPEWDDPDKRDDALERVLARVLRPAPLTKSELGVVFLSSHGLRYEQIGEMMHVSPGSARYYAKHARAKINAQTGMHLVATALRLGLIA